MAVLVIRGLPEHQIQVLALLALIEMGLVNLRYVDGYANHFIFGLVEVVLTGSNKNQKGSLSLKDLTWVVMGLRSGSFFGALVVAPPLAAFPSSSS